MRISDWSSDVCSSDLDIVLSGDYNKITGHEQLIQLAAYNPAVFSGPLAGFLGAMDPDRTLHRKSNWDTTDGGGPTVPNATSNPFYNALPDSVQQMYPQDHIVELQTGGATAKGNMYDDGKRGV